MCMGGGVSVNPLNGLQYAYIEKASLAIARPFCYKEGVNQHLTMVVPLIGLSLVSLIAGGFL